MPGRIVLYQQLPDDGSINNIMHFRYDAEEFPYEREPFQLWLSSDFNSCAHSSALGSLRFLLNALVSPIFLQ